MTKKRSSEFWRMKIRKFIWKR